jgi:oligopeptide transport system substrate-binding protein
MIGMLSRREFMRLAGITAALSTMVACAAPVAPGTIEPATSDQTPSETTSTGEIVTPQGRVLPPDAAPLDKQVFYTVAGEPRHLDISRDVYSASAALNLGGEPLLRRNENQELVPALAESWSAGPDAEYWDFVIREGARWSDGEPITAEDWVFTFRHISSPTLDTPWVWYYYDIRGVRAHKEGSGSADDIGVEAVDERTVRIWGETGSIPHLPALLAYQAASPAPKHLAEQDPENWANSIEGFVSSGPYIPVRWEHNQRIEWEINPYYNGPHTPAIQRVVQVLGTAQTNWFNVWLNREIDLIDVMTTADVQQARSNPELQDYLHHYNDFQTEYLALDTMNPPLDNLTLRQALSRALDRDALANQVLLGTYVPAYSMLPPGFPAYNPELQAVQSYNLEEARALLAEAGYPEGRDSNGNQLTLELYSNGRDVHLEFVKDQWERNLGIQVNLTVLEGAVWGQQRAEHAMMIYKGPYQYDYIDPSNMLTSLWRSTSAAGSPRHAWQSDEFDRLVTEAGSEVDPEQRIDMYQEAERILVEDVGGIFLTHRLIFQIWWPYVTGIPADESGNEVYRALDLTRFQMYIRNDVDEWRTPS